MRNYYSLLALFFVLSVSGQGFPDVPWFKTNGKNAKQISYSELISQFEEYAKKVDISKKGSGIKPFERWRSLWEPYFYRKGGFHPVKDIDDAYDKKRKLSQKSNFISNWTNVGPSVVDRNNRLPGKGRVNFVLIDPVDSHIMYVGTPAGGVWKTIDHGQTWSPLSDYLPQIGVSAIALSHQDHNIVFIGTGDDDAKDTYSRGVYKSTDGGTTWNPIGPNFLSDTQVIYEIIVHPNHDNILWVASSEGLYKTTDGGTTWDRVLIGNVRSLKRNLNNADILYASTTNSFYRSTDGGDHFSEVNLNFGFNPQRIEVEVTPAAADKVYLAVVKNDGGFGGVYISNDQGQNFTKTLENDNFFENTRQSWYDFAFAVSDTDPNTLFIGVINLSRSTDGGNNFVRINNWNIYSPNYTHADIHFLRYYNGVLAAGTDGGIYLSNDNGDTFTDYNEDLVISQFYKISTSLTQNYQIYGGLQDNGGFSRKDLVWRIYHGGDGMENAINNNEPNVGYSFVYYGASLSITTDGGISVSSGVEQPAGEKGNWVTPLDMAVNDSLYAGFKKLYRLENGVWQAVTNIGFTSNIDVIECDPHNSNIIYIAEGRKLYKSTNKGQTFTEIASAFSSITSIAVNPFDQKIWYTTDHWIYESSDNGSTWQIITGNYPGEHINIIKWQPYSPNNSIFLGTDLGVYHKDDTMSDWEVFSTNLPNVPVRDLEINFEYGILTAATFGRGIWETNIPVSNPDNDMALLDIFSSSGLKFMCDQNDIIKVKVKNKGNNIVPNFQLKYSINNTNNTIDYDTPVQPGEIVEITLPQLNGNLKKYEIHAEVLFANDEFIQNNTNSDYFLINKRDNLSFETSFENTAQDALLHYREKGNDTWEIGHPTGSVLSNAGTGVNAYCTNAGGEYDDLSKDYLVTPCFDMTQLINPTISFKLAFDIEENWDAFYVQYSTDFGQNWEVLGDATDPNWYNSDYEQSECIGKQWTGTNPAMETYSHDLSFLTDQTHVMFRFVLASDELEHQEGVVLDDLKISGTAGVNNQEIEKDIMLYPNPAKDIISLKWGNEIHVSRITVYSLDGKRIINKELKQATKEMINISSLPTGMYLVKIYTNKGQAVKKLIVN